jgi:hypothetical protein
VIASAYPDLNGITDTTPGHDEPKAMASPFLLGHRYGLVDLTEETEIVDGQIN